MALCNIDSRMSDKLWRMWEGLGKFTVSLTIVEFLAEI
jgi:hypothetical protein